VVEGCDNTGKTELIKQLKREFPSLIYVKSCGPQPGWAQWIWQELFLNLDARNRIYDRFFFSEFVYGPILRNSIEHPYPSLMPASVLATLHVIQPLVILCERYPGDVVGTFGARKQMEGVEERVTQIQEGYEKIVVPVLLDNDISYFSYDFMTPLAFPQARGLVGEELRKGWKPREH